MSQRNDAFAEVEALTRNVEKLDERLEQLGGMAGRNANSAASHISVNAGGVGVWISTTLCMVMLAVNILLIVILVDHNRQIGRMQDHLGAIYMMAPHLKPDKVTPEAP